MVDKECRELVGSLVDEMMRGPGHTFPYFKDPDPRRRRAALRIWAINWQKTDEYRTLCERLALEDPVEDVRICALEGVVANYLRTDNLRIGALLARMVKDQSKPILYRKKAHDGLFKVHGMPRENCPGVLWPKFDFPFPEIVDWPFVESFLKRAEGS